MNCKICGIKAESEYCFRHKQRKSLQAKRSSTINAKEKVHKSPAEMRELFMVVWKKRGHVSEVSGEKLFSPPSSVYFHHILLKNKYPQAAYDEENIILLTSEEHEIVHKDMYRYEEINKRRIVLLDKYDSPK
jgi:hypothetical protein